MEEFDTHLVRPPPVGFVVLQHPLPQHRHDLGKVLVREGGVGQFLHQRTGRAPRFVVGGLAHLALDLGVVHHHVGAGFWKEENEKKVDLISPGVEQLFANESLK